MVLPGRAALLSTSLFGTLLRLIHVPTNVTTDVAADVAVAVGMTVVVVGMIVVVIANVAIAVVSPEGNDSEVDICICHVLTKNWFTILEAFSLN